MRCSKLEESSTPLITALCMLLTRAWDWLFVRAPPPTCPLHLVNGLPFALDFVLGKEEVHTLSSLTSKTLQVPCALDHVRVLRPTGEEIDLIPLPLDPEARGEQIVNPLGAGVLRRMRKITILKGHLAPELPIPELHCGERAPRLWAQTWFKPPPEDLTVLYGETHTGHTVVEQVGDHHTAKEVLLRPGNAALLAPLLDLPVDPKDAYQAVTHARALLCHSGPDAALAWTEATAWEHRTDVLLSLLLTTARAAEKEDEVRERAWARRYLEPRDGFAERLLFNLLPPSEALELARERREESPADQHALMEVGWQLRESGELHAALAMFDAALEVSPEPSPIWQWIRQETLALLGDFDHESPELLALAESGHLPAQACLARLHGELPPFAMALEQLDRHWLRAAAGLKTSAKQLPFRTMALLWNDPLAALELGPEGYWRLDPEYQVLLAGLARRVGDSERCAELLDDLLLWGEGFRPHIARALAGSDEDFSQMHWALRSAVEFAASIQPDCPPERASALRTLALHHDPLMGLVTHLSAKFPLV